MLYTLIAIREAQYDPYGGEEIAFRKQISLFNDYDLFISECAEYKLRGHLQYHKDGKLALKTFKEGEYDFEITYLIDGYSSDRFETITYVDDEIINQLKEKYDPIFSKIEIDIEITYQKMLVGFKQKVKEEEERLEAVRAELEKAKLEEENDEGYQLIKKFLQKHGKIV